MSNFAYIGTTLNLAFKKLCSVAFNGYLIINLIKVFKKHI